MLIGDPERRKRIGESERKTVEQQYTYHATMPELLRVLSQVTGRAKFLVISTPGMTREDDP